MKKALIACSLPILSILLSGCIIVSSNKTQAPPKVNACEKKPCSQSPQVRATLAEIDAATKLISQKAQANIYMAIAKRPGISPEERIHLTNAVSKHLISESDKENILLALVNNHLPMPVSRRVRKTKTQTETSTPCTAKPEKKTTLDVSASEK